jgi:integrase
MARTIKPVAMSTRTARAKLRRGRYPTWNAIAQRVHLGYQRWPGEPFGRWILRRWIDGGYTMMAFADADDSIAADGIGTLSYFQARERALELAGGERVRGSATVRHALEIYFRDLRARGKSVETAAAAAHYILPALGDVALAELTTRALTDWLATVAAVPVRRKVVDGDEAMRRRRNSANRIAGVLVASLNLAYRDGLVASDGAWRRLRRFRGVDAARVRYLSIDECTRLLNACPEVFRRLVRSALSTGCRYGELIALEVGDLDLDAGTICVRKSKSGRPRFIPLNDESLAFFRSLATGRSGGERLLTRGSGEPWARSNQKRPMLAACANARIVPPVGFHILRHTFASHAVMRGAPLPVVAAALGHRDTRMTERHYAHLAPSYVADAIRAAALVLGPEPTLNVESLRPANVKRNR